MSSVCIAWMGDYLFDMVDDGNDSKYHFLGEANAAVLQERNIALSDTSDCHKYCNPLSTVGASVPKARDKQRLKTQKDNYRRKRKKSNGNKQKQY